MLMRSTTRRSQYELDSWDDENELGGLFYCVRNRYRDPVTGTFLSRDPLPPQIGGDINPYRYAKNSPPNYTDPDGLAARPANSNLQVDLRLPSGSLGPMLGPEVTAIRDALFAPAGDYGRQATPSIIGAPGDYTTDALPMAIGSIQFTVRNWMDLNPQVFSGNQVSHVGWTYVARDLTVKPGQIYVGGASGAISGRVVSGHQHWGFLSRPGTEIGVQPVYGAPDVNAAGTRLAAVRHTVFSQEQIVLQRQLDFGKRTGAMILNNQVALTEVNQPLYQMQNRASLGPETVVKLSGEPIDLARTRMIEMDARAGFLRTQTVQSMGVKAVNVLGAAQLGLEIYKAQTGVGNEMIVEGPMVFNDALGQFTVAAPPSWQFWRSPTKEYISGHGVRLDKMYGPGIIGPQQWKKIKAEHEQRYKDELEALRLQQKHGRLA